MPKSNFILFYYWFLLSKVCHFWISLDKVFKFERTMNTQVQLVGNETINIKDHDAQLTNSNIWEWQDFKTCMKW